MGGQLFFSLLWHKSSLNGEWRAWREMVRWVVGVLAEMQGDARSLVFVNRKQALELARRRERLGACSPAVAQFVAGWGVAGMGGGISAGGGSAGGDTGGCASQKWQDCSLASVRLHAVGVGLVEKLWMISNAASTVLFPRVAAETEEQRQKEFTPLVA